MQSVYFECSGYLTPTEESHLRTFNRMYDSWCEDSHTYFEHLNKTIQLLDFIRSDISSNKVLYSACDKCAMIKDETSKCYIGDLMNHVMSDPLTYFDRNDFREHPHNFPLHRDAIKHKEEQVEQHRQDVTMTSDYRYYFINNDMVEYIGVVSSD